MSAVRDSSAKQAAEISRELVFIVNKSMQSKGELSQEEKSYLAKVYKNAAVLTGMLQKKVKRWKSEKEQSDEAGPSAAKKRRVEIEAKKFSDLPDKLQNGILEKLTIHDQLRARNTCKKWRNWMPFKGKVDGTLNLAELRLKRQYRTIAATSDEILAVLTSILPTWGKHLSSLSFNSGHSFRCFNISDAQLDLITNFCPNLKSLRLGDVVLPHEPLGIRRLSRLTRLTSFSLAITNGNCRPADRINYAAYRGPFNSQLKALLSTWPLESLELKEKFLRDRVFSSDLPPMPTLTRLHLYLVGVTNDQFAQICRSCAQLERIRLEGISTFNDYSPLRHLGNLTRLCLFMTGSLEEDNQQLDQIAVNWPKLSHVSVTGCLRNHQFNWLANCPLLEYLHTDSSNLNIANLHNCPSLKKLDVRGVELTTTKMIQLSVLPQLEQLIVEDAYKQPTCTSEEWRQVAAERRHKMMETPLIIGVRSDELTDIGDNIRADLAQVYVTVTDIFKLSADLTFCGS